MLTGLTVIGGAAPRGGPNAAAGAQGVQRDDAGQSSSHSPPHTGIMGLFHPECWLCWEGRLGSMKEEGSW